ncbi:MAG: heavy-metal-associated domain-containing protein [Prevotellaceae bacterium]|jgi:copper chaperone CopZ|nr:heavy-metal-associated domain-containing protein [Prevotellaceae bacterium]
MKTKILFIAIALIACVLGVNAQSKKGETAAKKTEVVFHISNMHGEHCKKIITEGIAYEKGVKDLKFDLDKQNLTIVYDEKKTTTDALQKALEKLGYDAKTASCAADGTKTENKSCCKSHH